MNQSKIVTRIAPRAKHKHLLFSFIFVILNTTSSFIHANDLLYTFQQALQHDPTFKAAEAIKNSASEFKTQSFAHFLPSIAANANASQTNQQLDKSAFVSNDQLGNNSFKSSEFSLKLRQPLLNWQAIQSYKTANLKQTKAEVDYRIAQQDLLYRVAKTYFLVLLKKEALFFARAEKKAINTQLNLTKKRYELGIVAITEVHEASARLDLASANEIILETALQIAESNLQNITYSKIVRFKFLKENLPLIAPSPANIDSWVNTAKVQNLNIAVAQLEADIAKLQIDLIRAKRLPTIDLTTTLAYNTRGGPYREERQDNQIAFDMNLPLFGGNRISSEIRQAIFLYEAANQHTEAIERIALGETRSAYLKVIAAMSFIKAISQANISTEKALNAIKAGFEIGAKSTKDVLDAQNLLYHNKRDHAQARHDYVLNTLKLKMSVGLLSINDLEQVNSWLE